MKRNRLSELQAPFMNRENDSLISFDQKGIWMHNISGHQNANPLLGFLLLIITAISVAGIFYLITL